MFLVFLSVLLFFSCGDSGSGSSPVAFPPSTTQEKQVLESYDVFSVKNSSNIGNLKKIKIYDDNTIDLIVSDAVKESFNFRKRTTSSKFKIEDFCNTHQVDTTTERIDILEDEKVTQSFENTRWKGTCDGLEIDCVFSLYYTAPDLVLDFKNIISLESKTDSCEVIKDEIESVSFSYQYQDPIVSNREAFAFLKNDKTVVVSGATNYGGNFSNSSFGLDCDGDGGLSRGDSSNISCLTNVKSLYSTNKNFIAVKENNQVHIWGRDVEQENIPIVNENIKQVVYNEGANAILTDSGKVYVWGDSFSGGNLSDATYGLDCDKEGVNSRGDSSNITCLDGVEKIVSLNRGFAALKNGNLFVWGFLPPEDNTFGVDCDGDGILTQGESTACLTNVKKIVSNNSARLVLTNDGRIYSWGVASAGGSVGDATYGIDCDGVGGNPRGQGICPVATDYTDIFSFNNRMIAYNGVSAYTWGNGLIASTLKIDNVSDIKVNNVMAIAKQNNSFITWGDSNGLYTSSTQGIDCNYDDTNGDVDCIDDAQVDLSKTGGLFYKKSNIYVWGSSIEYPKIQSSNGLDCDYDGSSGNFDNELECILDKEFKSFHFNERAIATLTSDGQVLAWGGQLHGGEFVGSTGLDCDGEGVLDRGDINNISCLDSDIIAIYSDKQGANYVALKNDGQVYDWGGDVVNSSYTEVRSVDFSSKLIGF